MKYFKYLPIILLLLLIVSFMPSNKQRKTKPAAQAPFGHVQSIYEVSYNANEDSAGNITKGGIISDTDYNPMIRSNRPTSPSPSPPIQLWVYDEFGNEIKNTKWHANGKIFTTEIHIYNDNGDIMEVIDSSYASREQNASVKIEQHTYKYDTSGKILVANKWDYYMRNIDHPMFIRKVNIYDSIGKLKEVMTFNSDTINPQTIIFSAYNKKGKLVETDERRRRGNDPGVYPYEKNDFWYDEKGRLTDKAMYNPNGGLTKDEKTTYDSTGRTITTYYYGQNNEVNRTVVKRIIKNIHITQEDTYDKDGFLTDYTISHDSAKHVLDMGTFHVTYNNALGPDHRYHNVIPGDTEMVHHTINDDHFNMVEDDTYTIRGKPGSLKFYQYTYDNAGNWTAKIEFDNNKVVKIIEREIGYFND